MTTAAPSLRRSAPGPRSVSAGRGGLLSRPSWPITALLVGYPIWWALGIADFTWIFLAVPMVVRMVGWRRSGRRTLTPPGFGLWLMFLVVALIGVAMLGQTAPSTVASPLSHRVLSFGNRMLGYGGDTVLLLYAGNLTERELPRQRLGWMLGLVGLYAVVGGLGGMAKPGFQFNSPFLLALPKSVQANPFIQASMHPGFSQIQNVLGSPSGRPKAPFDYTNTWGECLSILMPWLVVSWWRHGTRRQRRIAAVAVPIGLLPLLYSLNRGVWIGIGFSLVYLAVRFARRGNVAPVGALAAGLVLAVVLLLATPLHSVVSGRLSHGKSNNLRANLSSLSVKAAVSSPFVGYGDTRQERGSPQSIAVGPSPVCPSCGQLALGSTGQLWLLLVCSGILGAALYLSFFAVIAWRYRRDVSDIGLAAELVVLLSFVYMFTYDATGAPLGFTMLAVALLWKNDRVIRGRDGEAFPIRPPAAEGRDRQRMTGGMRALETA